MRIGEGQAFSIEGGLDLLEQVEAGVDIMSDGELGKVGYSTYMIERLSGFGGHIDRKPAADLAEVPNLAKKLSAIMGSQEFVRASCIGPVKLVTLDPLHEDIRRFKAALPGYPIALTLYVGGAHGAPVRMIDWRLVLNRMLDQREALRALPPN